MKIRSELCVRARAGWGIVAGIAFLAGCRSAPKLTPQQAAGKHLYDGRCAHCHEDNDLALKKVPPDLQAIFEGQTIRERLLATLALFFAIVAWLLAGVGLYGVLIYSVIQRQREIGIRMALGAQAGDIVRPVVAATMYAVALGSVAGLGAGLISTRFIESLLYEAKASDASMVATPCLAIGLAVTMALAPAVVRALRTNPVSLLRAE